jgi:hypothetical protein
MKLRTLTTLALSVGVLGASVLPVAAQAAGSKHVTITMKSTGGSNGKISGSLGSGTASYTAQAPNVLFNISAGGGKLLISAKIVKNSGGKLGGSWKITRGSGKFAGASGTGTWSGTKAGVVLSGTAKI